MVRPKAFVILLVIFSLFAIHGVSAYKCGGGETIWFCSGTQGCSDSGTSNGGGTCTENYCGGEEGSCNVNSYGDTCGGTGANPSVTYYYCNSGVCNSAVTSQSDFCTDNGNTWGSGTCSAGDWSCTGSPGTLSETTTSGTDTCPGGYNNPAYVQYYACSGGNTCVQYDTYVSDVCTDSGNAYGGGTCSGTDYVCSGWPGSIGSSSNGGSDYCNSANSIQYYYCTGGTGGASNVCVPWGNTVQSDACTDSGTSNGGGTCSADDWNCAGSPATLTDTTSSGSDSCGGTGTTPIVTYYYCSGGNHCSSSTTSQTDSCSDNGNTYGSGTCSYTDWSCSGSPGTLSSSSGSGIDFCGGTGGAPSITYFYCSSPTASSCSGAVTGPFSDFCTDTGTSSGGGSCGATDYSCSGYPGTLTWSSSSGADTCGGTASVPVLTYYYCTGGNTCSSTTNTQYDGCSAGGGSCSADDWSCIGSPGSLSDSTSSGTNSCLATCQIGTYSCVGGNSCSYSSGFLSGNGKVCSGGAEVNPSSGTKCDQTVNCVNNACSAQTYYRGCATGSGSCTETNKQTGTTWVASNVTISNETNYKVGSTCTTTASVLCAPPPSPPTLSSVVVNSTYPHNTTAENLTAWVTASDATGVNVSITHNWRINGSNMAILIMSFNMNNSAGTNITRDYSMNNNGTAFGPTWVQNSGMNMSDAYSFNGVNNYIDAGNSSILNPAAITIAMWVLIPSAPSNNGNMIAKGSNSGYRLRINNAQTVSFLDRGGTNALTTAKTITANQWTHIAAVGNASGLQIYINGVINASSGTAYGSPNTAANLTIGASVTDGEYFNGSLDEVRVYNRSLTPLQILLLANNRTDMIANTELSPGQNWTDCAYASNPRNETGPLCTSKLLVNYGATTVFANTTPTPAYTTTSVQGWCNGTTDTGISMAYYDQWFRNGTLYTTSFANNGGSNYTNGLLANVIVMGTGGTHGDTWILSCMATDGITNGSWVNSTGFTFSNTAPTISSLVMNSTTGLNVLTDNLTAYATTSDADNDKVSIAYDWRKNGTSIAAFNMNFDVNNSGGSGKTKDYSKYSNNGTVSGAIWNATGGANGTGAYKFYRNSSDAIYVLPAGTYAAANITITAWIKRDQLGIWGGIFARCSGDFYYMVHSSDVTLFSWTNSSSGQRTCSGPSIADTNWHFVAVTTLANGSAVNITEYVDSNQASCANNEGMTAAQGTSYIGSMNNACGVGGTVLNGSIDSIAFYNRTLSPQEIQAIYNNQSNVVVSPEFASADSWQVCVTPNDGQADGSSSCSGSVQVGIPTIVINSFVVNSTFGTNTTAENVTAYVSATGSVSNITYMNDWRVNGTSITVLNYNFDVNNSATGNTQRDYSTYMNNGSPTTAPGTSVWTPNAGRNFTGAFVFNGSGGINMTTLPTLTDFTYEIWIKVTSYTNGAGNNGAGTYFVDRTIAGTPLASLKPANDRYDFQYRDSASTIGGLDGGFIKLNQWQHVVWGRKVGKELFIYVDGVKTRMLDTLTTIQPDPPTIGGRNPAGGIGNGLRGSIDEFRIYSRALSNDEVQALYRNNTFAIQNEELTSGQNWTDCVTANDQSLQSATSCSAGLVVKNTTLYVTAATINSTTGVNTTRDDLNAFYTIQGGLRNPDVIYDWRLNGSSITVVNMNFDVNNSAGSGVTRDYGTSGNNGTVTGAAWNATGGFGGTGAYQFINGSTYITLPSTVSSQLGKTITASAWVYIRNSTGSPWKGIISELYAGDGNVQLEVDLKDVGTGGYLSVGIYDGSWHEVTDTTLFPLLSWQHIAASYDGSTLKLYRNGALVGSSYLGITMPTGTNGWAIGKRHDGVGAGPDFTNGTIDNVMIFNRSLSPSEINNLYNDQYQIMRFNELRGGNNWSVCVSANDGAQEGTNCSVGLNVLYTAPTITNLSVTSDDGKNLTLANITANATAAGGNSGIVNVIHDWRINDTSFAVLNMNFDVNNSGGSGKTRDYSKSSFNGTVNAGVVWNATGGRNGTGAYRFNGSGYISIPTTFGVTNGNITLAAWVYVNGTSQHGQVLGVGSSNGIHMGIGNGGDMNTAGNIFMMIFESIRWINTGTSVGTGWHHMAMVVNGSGTPFAYLDGTSLGAFGGTNQNIPDAAVAEVGGYNRPYDGGYVDDAMIFNRTLSAQEIQALYLNRTNVIVTNELKGIQNWTDCVTANDGLTDGTANCSSGLITRDPTDIITTVIVNSTRGRNTTQENLTSYVGMSAINIPVATHDWRLNGSSIAVVNMNFDVNNSAGAGKTLDVSSFGNNGTITSTTWGASYGINGTGGYYFGGGGYINIPDATSLNPPAQVSVAAWVKTNNSVANTVIFSKTTGCASSGYLLWINENAVAPSRIGLFIGAGAWLDSTANITDDKWHYVVGTFNGSVANVYIDGILNVTGARTGTLNSAVPLQIGGSTNCPAGGYFTGYMDNVQVYNRSLSAQEIAVLYANRSDVLVSQELSYPGNWTDCVAGNDGTYQTPVSKCSYGVILSSACIPAATNANWFVWGQDQCEYLGQTINLGTGTFTLSGSGYLWLYNSVLKAAAINVLNNTLFRIEGNSYAGK